MKAMDEHVLRDRVNLSILMIFFIVMTVSGMERLQGNSEIPENPTLVFEGEHNLVFGKNNDFSIQNFYKCLCNDTKTSCMYGFDYKKSRDFYKVDRILSEKKNDNCSVSITEGNLTCYAGPFIKEGRGILSCTRSTDSFFMEWCKSKTYCQLFSVSLPENGEYEECPNKHVIMMWLTTQLESKEFEKIPKFVSLEKDTAPSVAPTPTSQTTIFDAGTSTLESSSRDTGVTRPSQSQDRVTSNSDSSQSTVVIAIGWTLFALAVGIIFVLFVCLCRKRKLGSNKSRMEQSSPGSNVTRNRSTKPTLDGKDLKTGFTKHPVSETEKNRSDYDYYTAYGLTTSDYNFIDEDKRFSSVDTTKTGLTGYDLQTPAVNMKGETCGKFGYSVAGQTESARSTGDESTKPREDGEVNHGYLILEADCDSQYSKETTDDADSGNQASDALPIDQSNSRVSGSPPTDQ